MISPVRVATTVMVVSSAMRMRGGRVGQFRHRRADGNEARRLRELAPEVRAARPVVFEYRFGVKLEGLRRDLRRHAIHGSATCLKNG